MLILWENPHNSFIYIYFFTEGLMSADIIALPGVLTAHTLTLQAFSLTSWIVFHCNLGQREEGKT